MFIVVVVVLEQIQVPVLALALYCHHHRHHHCCYLLEKMRKSVLRFSHLVLYTKRAEIEFKIGVKVVKIKYKKLKQLRQLRQISLPTITISEK
jgi:hypothetical protein